MCRLKCTKLNFPLVLCGCETWSLMLWDEHRLRVFKNRLLRRIFGSKRVEVTGGQRILRNDEKHNDLCSWPYIVSMMKWRRLRWADYLACMGENFLQGFGGKPWRNDSKVIGISGRITLQLILKEWNRRLWTEFIWLRIVASGGVLWT
jgi:hypothetical protein